MEKTGINPRSVAALFTQPNFVKCFLARFWKAVFNGYTSLLGFQMLVTNIFFSVTLKIVYLRILGQHCSYVCHFKSLYLRATSFRAVTGGSYSKLYTEGDGPLHQLHPSPQLSLPLLRLFSSPMHSFTHSLIPCLLRFKFTYLSHPDMLPLVIINQERVMLCLHVLNAGQHWAHRTVNPSEEVWTQWVLVSAL